MLGLVISNLCNVHLFDHKLTVNPAVTFNLYEKPACAAATSREK